MRIGRLCAMVILTLVAIGHLLRLLLRFGLTVAGWEVPLWASALFFVVTGGVAFLLWRESRAA